MLALLVFIGGPSKSHHGHDDGGGKVNCCFVMAANYLQIFIEVF